MLPCGECTSKGRAASKILFFWLTFCCGAGTRTIGSPAHRIGVLDMTAKFEPTRRATLAGLSILALSGGQAAFAQTPKKGGTLNFLITNEPNTLMSGTTTATTALTVSGKTKRRRCLKKFVTSYSHPTSCVTASTIMPTAMPLLAPIGMTPSMMSP